MSRPALKAQSAGHLRTAIESRRYRASSIVTTVRQRAADSRTAGSPTAEEPVGCRTGGSPSEGAGPSRPRAPTARVLRRRVDPRREASSGHLEVVVVAEDTPRSPPRTVRCRVQGGAVAAPSRGRVSPSMSPASRAGGHVDDGQIRVADAYEHVDPCPAREERAEAMMSSRSIVMAAVKRSGACRASLPTDRSGTCNGSLPLSQRRVPLDPLRDAEVGELHRAGATTLPGETSMNEGERGSSPRTLCAVEVEDAAAMWEGGLKRDSLPARRRYSCWSCRRRTPSLQSFAVVLPSTEDPHGC